MTRRLLLLALPALVVGVVGLPAHASNDPLFSVQYGPQMIQAPYAWAKSRGADVTIAIMDSGVDLDHPDLKDKIVPGYDFADDDSNPDNDVDDNIHGTHVAGIAAAITDNGVGIAGVAPDAKIMPVKAFKSSGNASCVDDPKLITVFALSIRFAADNGAHVINGSIGDCLRALPAAAERIETACEYAYARGTLCVLAAGNESEKTQEEPSGWSHDIKAIVVTANDAEGRHASFGSRADTAWSVTAPGVKIRSTLPGGKYGDSQGTSMATPHVAGAAALLFGAGMSIDQVVQQLLATAKPLNNNPQLEGAGLINVAAALGVTVPEETPAGQPSAGGATPASPRGASRAPGSAGAVAGATATPEENADATAGLAASSDEEAPIPLAAPAVRRAASEDDGGSAAPAIIVAAIVGLAIGVFAALRIRRRRAGPSPVRLY